MGYAAGYAVVSGLARRSSAVSAEAQVVRNAARAVIDLAECSYALFGPKIAVISLIRSIARDCAEPDWNGEGARPLSPEAVESAEEFVRALPTGYPLPDVAPEPDGAVSFDWIQSRHRLLTLSISVNKRLAYAWLDGTDRGHAVAYFDGATIPQGILECIERVMNRGSSTVGTA